MTIDKIDKQKTEAVEKPPISVQNELQKEVLKEASGTGANSNQKQVLQILASAQPTMSVQELAQNQIKKGYVDIKV